MGIDRKHCPETAVRVMQCECLRKAYQVFERVAMFVEMIGLVHMVQRTTVALSLVLFLDKMY